jgi:hypothetical protein
MRGIVRIGTVLTIGLAACSAFEAPGPVLTGTWGSYFLLLHANSSGTTLSFICASGATGPLYVNGAGVATSGGSYQRCALGTCTTSTLWFEGRQVGDTLLATVFLARRDSAHATQFQLVRNDSLLPAALCAQ